MKKFTYFFEWLVYTGFAMLFIFPFYVNLGKFIGLSLLIGFFAGMGNRIIRELIEIQKLLKK